MALPAQAGHQGSYAATYAATALQPPARQHEARTCSSRRSPRSSGVPSSPATPCAAAPKLA